MNIWTVCDTVELGRYNLLITGFSIETIFSGDFDAKMSRWATPGSIVYLFFTFWAFCIDFRGSSRGYLQKPVEGAESLKCFQLFIHPLEYQQELPRSRAVGAFS